MACMLQYNIALMSKEVRGMHCCTHNIGVHTIPSLTFWCHMSSLSNVLVSQEVSGGMHAVHNITVVNSPLLRTTLRILAKLGQKSDGDELGTATRPDFP